MKRYIKSSLNNNTISVQIENEIYTTLQYYFNDIVEDPKYNYLVETKEKPDYFDDGTDALFIYIYLDGDALDWVEYGNHQDELFDSLDSIVSKYCEDSYFEWERYGVLVSCIWVD